jgi:hypothetical protein
MSSDGTPPKLCSQGFHKLRFVGVQRNWYRSKASQIKRSQKQKGGEYNNGIKYTNAKTKRTYEWAFADNQKEPIYKDRLSS